MNENFNRKRLKDLEDHIRKDLNLLKKYEDKLRYETDLRRLAGYHQEIEQLRESLTRYQKEYDELQKQMSPEELQNVTNLLHDYSPRLRLFNKLDLPPPTDMTEYKKEKNKKVLLQELKLMTIDGDLTDEEIHALLQEAKKEGMPDEETIQLIVEFANKNTVKIVGFKEEKLPGIRKDLLALRKDYKT